MRRVTAFGFALACLLLVSGIPAATGAPVGLADCSPYDCDSDGVPDLLDNCPTVYNPSRTDNDGDGVGSACDNCPFDANPDQADTNGNGIGDRCDLKDGLIMIGLTDTVTVSWQPDSMYLRFDLYRGGLKALSDADHDGAADSYGACRASGLGVSWYTDPAVPPVGDGFIYIATGLNQAGGSGMGQSSDGALRPNTDPCPPFDFGQPPVIESVNLVAQRATAYCDVTNTATGLLCVNGILPDSYRFYPQPSITIQVGYSEFTFLVHSTDSDSTPAQNDILLVTATYTIDTQTGQTISLPLLDDGSENVTPFRQSREWVDDCTYDAGAGVCICAAATYPVTSNDMSKDDDTFTRAVAFLAGSPNTTGSAVGLMESCVARARHQDPTWVSFLVGAPVPFTIDVTDHVGNHITWPETPAAAISPSSISCTGDECACCLLLTSDPAVDCVGLPGVVALPGNQVWPEGLGLCQTLL